PPAQRASPVIIRLFAGANVRLSELTVNPSQLTKMLPGLLWRGGSRQKRSAIVPIGRLTTCSGIPAAPSPARLPRPGRLPTVAGVGGGSVLVLRCVPGTEAAGLESEAH